MSPLDPVQVATLEFAEAKKKPGVPKGYKFAKPRITQRGKQMDAFIEDSCSASGARMFNLAIFSRPAWSR